MEALSILLRHAEEREHRRRYERQAAEQEHQDLHAFWRITTR
jgi:hypothetical protein